MAFSAAAARTRAGQALRAPHNWVQLAKFSAVGLSGYVINLVVYTALLKGAGFHYAVAATCSFLVAVTNNYTWNRLWTFHAQRGHVGWQGLRFLVVALVASIANLDAGLERVISVRAEVGTRLQAIDTAADFRDSEEVDLQALISDIRDVDYASAISQLNQQYTSLQAAQATYSKIAQLSLFDYL